jgi:putative membrane protein
MAVFPQVPGMLWLKAFHVIFVVTWFAGLFYLPRLFIYHVEATEPALRERFKVMERRLLGITHIGGALAVVFGLALMGWWLGHAPAVLFAPHWFEVKLALVAVLVVYHLMLIGLRRQLARGDLRWSSRALRLFNEVPSLLLVAIVIMVIVKPF